MASRTFAVKGIEFLIGNYTPRNNEYEKDLKYSLYVKVDDSGCVFWMPTDYKFSTIKECKEWAEREWVRFA